jgi:hypothetical protein
VLGLFAMAPAEARAETVASDLDQAGFDAAIASPAGKLILADGDTYRLTENITVGQNAKIQTDGTATIDLNGCKITVVSGYELGIRGVSVTGVACEYIAGGAGIEVGGRLIIDGGSIEVSGESAVGVKVNPGGQADLRQTRISAPGIALYANGGNALVSGGGTTITADPLNGTAVKADSAGSVLLFDFDRIEAFHKFDNASDAGDILNFKEMVAAYEADGITILNLSNPVPPGTAVMLKYTDSEAEDAGGMRVYYTTDGSEPSALTETFLDGGHPTALINVSRTMSVKMGTPLEAYMIPLPPINISVSYTFDDFLSEFNSISGSGGTITLTQDLILAGGQTVTLSADEEVIINTGSHRIIVEGKDIEDHGTVLAIKDKVKITGSGDGSKPNLGVVLARDHGTFQMLGGTVESTAPNGAAVSAASGKVEIQGGVIFAHGTSSTGVLLSNGGNANIAGGKIISNPDTGVGVKADGQYACAIISGGKILAKTAKVKGASAENPERIYDFRGIDIMTTPAFGFITSGTAVTVSKRELSGDLDPMDAAGADVYYTTDDSSPLDSGTKTRLDSSSNTVTIDSSKAINAAAVAGDGSGGLQGPICWFPYIASDAAAIDHDIAILKSISNYAWAHEALEKLFRKFILPELNPTEEWLGGQVTRARLAKLVSIAFKLPHDSYFRSSFDGDSIWNAANQGFVRYIEIAKNYFIYTDSTFEPERAVTREELVYTILKVLGFRTDNLTDEMAESAAKYSKDWDAVDDRYKPSVALATKMGIVSGFNGRFKPMEPVTNAEMAVLLYRALTFSGGVGNGVFTDMKPGDYGYEATTDLANRLSKTADNHLSLDANNNFGPNAYATEADWDKWKAVLGVSLAYPGEDTTKRVDAAIQLVNALPAASKKAGQVFSDVAPADWCYDGVMNLYSRKIIQGFEDGTFRPDEQLPTVSLAYLIARQKGIAFDGNMANNQEILAYFPDDPAAGAKEAAAYAVLKLLGIDTSDMNPGSVEAILEKFNDRDSISTGCKPAMAYMVSIGVLKGDENGNLAPKAMLTRGAFAVFYSRVLNGLDMSKMKDYADTIEAAE